MPTRIRLVVATPSGADDLELATLSWVHWCNHESIHSAFGRRPTVEAEDEYYATQTTPEEQPLAG